MKFEVDSGGQRYEIEAPDEAAAMKAIQGLMSSVKPQGNPAAMLGGAGQAAAGAAQVNAPSVASDIGDSVASRYQAGLLDIPGIPGDLGNLAGDAGGWVAGKVLGLMGKSPEQVEAARAKAEGLTKGAVSLPGSEDIKQAVGFEAYQPQTGAGKVFDRYIGAGIELAPSAVATGGAGAAKKIGGDVLKFAMAPAAAGEAAGEVTKGTALEPWARAGAMLLTGGAAGAKRAKVTGAKSIDDWRMIGKQAYDDMKQAGVGVKASSFDRAVSDIERELNVAGFRPALHPQVATVLKEMKSVRNAPQSYEELDQLHRLAMGQTKNIDPDTRRIAGMLAGKIDDFMENLKPRDLMAGDPNEAFKALSKGRDAWRKMRTGERIQNLMERARDRVGANYTAAGMQTAIRQEFKNFKWKGRREVSREFKMLTKDEQAVVDSIIRGVSVENSLRLIGKFNIRNPFAQTMMVGLGVTGSPLLAGGMLLAGEGARRLSARGTLAKAERLGEMVRGGKVTPGSRGLPPQSVIYGIDAERKSD